MRFDLGIDQRCIGQVAHADHRVIASPSPPAGVHAG
jgi:hypothetical protein